MTMPNKKNFDQLLIFVNSYKHEKNEAVSLISPGEIVDLKSCNLRAESILIFIWIQKTLLLVYFWPISPIFGAKKVIQFAEKTRTDNWMEGWTDPIS